MNCHADSRPRLHFRASDCRSYLSFGLYQMGERFVNFLSANVDYLIIGKLLGAEALGFYSIAYKLVAIPLKRLNPIVTSVAFPVFSLKQKDDKALRSGYLEMSKALSLISFPLLAGIAVTAPLIIPILYGPGWEPSVPLLQALSLLGILKSLGNPSGSIILAKGRADLGFKFNLTILVVNAVVFYIAAHQSALAVALSFSALTFLYFIALQTLVVNRMIQLGWGPYLKTIAPACLSCLGMMACVIGSRWALSFTSIAPVALLAVSIGIGVLGYGCFAYPSNRGFVDSILAALKGKERRIP